MNLKLWYLVSGVRHIQHLKPCILVALSAVITQEVNEGTGVLVDPEKFKDVLT